MDRSDGPIPTSSTEGLDKDALALERRIFLKSPIAKKLIALLALKHKIAELHAVAAAGPNPFERVFIDREDRLPGWYITGYLNGTAYGLVVSDVEIQYSKLV